MKIVCFHLYNDYSGSPKVLFDVISGLCEKGIEVELVTSKGGVLDDLKDKGVRCRTYSYTFSPRVLVTMARYAWIQIRTICMALRYAFQKDAVFYINTILPAGPALAGKLTGKRVVYHYHENAFVKSGFYRALAGLMERIADKIICVSCYQASFLSAQDKVLVIPNAQNPDFTAKLRPDPERAFDRKNVLMLSSLKAYKGTLEFINLASEMPRFRFTLVINDTESEIEKWLKGKNAVLPDNLTLYPRTADVSGYYNNASLVLNLSNPHLFIETFGLTAIEAMSCALPVIVPTEGGIAEMVEDGRNGFHINCYEVDRMKETITKILSDKQLYISMAKEALKYSGKFDKKEINDAILSLLLN